MTSTFNLPPGWLDRDLDREDEDAEDEVDPMMFFDDEARDWRN